MEAPAIPQWDLLLPLDGIQTMLELGNKKTMAGLVYKGVFEKMGIRHTSVDWNGEDGALALDLRKPLNLGRFDIVTNFGTSEHVDQQEPVWRNMIEATGKILICSTPYPGDWDWHGIHYPKATFYQKLADLNGFVLERLKIASKYPRRLIQARLRRQGEQSFVMPDQALIFKNKP